MAAPATGTRDGRTVRAERTREAVVVALLALLDEGELTPTAERVAERAGVSERSIFQHFGDREALFEAAAVLQYERIMPTLRPVDPALPLDKRLDAFVAQRARLLEQVKGVRRAALLLEHESETIAGWLNAARRAKALEVDKVFATELAAMPDPSRPALRAALVTACAWPAWESYRIHQRLGFDRARAAMRVAMAALLREAC
jgi:TetR/AcrR family transcriptional regulator of autoinduction and epiphytic fitness